MTGFQRLLLIIRVGQGYLLELKISIIRTIDLNRIVMLDQQMGELSQVHLSKALRGINIILMNINKVTHSEDLKSNIKEDADGK